jgi:hypothetical protein
MNGAKGKNMRIRVDSENEIHGNSILWEGDARKIHTIHDIPVRITAALVVKDGRTRTSGKWTIAIVKEGRQ